MVVQHRRTVRVQHALRVPGGARGVAQRRGRALVELGPGEGRIGRRVGEQRFVAGEIANGRRGRLHRFLVGQRVEAPDGREFFLQRLDQRRKRQVEEQDPVFRMVDDVFEMLRRQPRVDRVQHGAKAHYREVQFEMAIGVGRQRRHHAAMPDTELLQGNRQAARALAKLAPVAAVDGAFDRARDDLDVRVEALRVLKQR
ncbi:hypothetical protein D3C72_1583410 [compost metagenome]